MPDPRQAAAKLRPDTDPDRTRGQPLAFTGAHPFRPPGGQGPGPSHPDRPPFRVDARLRAAAPRSRATDPSPSHYDPHPLRSALERNTEPLNSDRARPIPSQKPTTAPCGPRAPPGGSGTIRESARAMTRPGRRRTSLDPRRCQSRDRRSISHSTATPASDSARTTAHVTATHAPPSVGVMTAPPGRHRKHRPVLRTGPVRSPSRPPISPGSRADSMASAP